MNPKSCSYIFAGSTGRRSLSARSLIVSQRIHQDDPLPGCKQSASQDTEPTGWLKVCFLPVEDQPGNKKPEKSLVKTFGAVERPKQSALNWQTLLAKVTLKYDREFR